MWKHHRQSISDECDCVPIKCYLQKQVVGGICNKKMLRFWEENTQEIAKKWLGIVNHQHLPGRENLHHWNELKYLVTSQPRDQDRLSPSLWQGYQCHSKRKWLSQRKIGVSIRKSWAAITQGSLNTKEHLLQQLVYSKKSHGCLFSGSVTYPGPGFFHPSVLSPSVDHLQQSASSLSSLQDSCCCSRGHAELKRLSRKKSPYLPHFFLKSRKTLPKASV